MRVLVSDPLPEASLAPLKELKDLDLVIKTGLNAAALKKEVAKADALIVRSGTKVNAPLLKQAKRLQIIGRAGVGIDNIDCEACTRQGIVVVNTPLGNVDSAAEHTLALMLAAHRHIAPAHQSVISGQWRRKDFLGHELRGKHLGIIGFGKIGRRVAKVALALDMTVSVYDPFLSDQQCLEHNVGALPLKTLFRQCDVITLHTPLTADTENLINQRSIKSMKKGVILLNVARGGLVNEADLARALKSGHVAAAGMDVFCDEPPRDSPLLSAPHVVLTPHLGASTTEAQERVATDVARQIVTWFRDRKAPGALNSQQNLPTALQPYMPLAQTLGHLGAQLFQSSVDKVHIEGQGDLDLPHLEALSGWALAGILKDAIDTPLNAINAQIHTKERGIKITQSHSDMSTSWPNMLSLTVSHKRSTLSLGGTCVGDQMLLTHIGAFQVNTPPSAHMIVITYPDQPGMAGQFSSLIGQHNINIGRMVLGRQQRNARQAMVLITTDSPVPKSLITQLKRKLPKATVQSVSLPSAPVIL